MHPELRSQFNADFTAEKYAALLRCVNETEKWPADWKSKTHIDCVGRDFDIWFDSEQVLRRSKLLV